MDINYVNYILVSIVFYVYFCRQCVFNYNIQVRISLNMVRSTHVVDLTEEDKEKIYQNIQNMQSFQNQSKMGGSPSRRRQFVDTGDTGPYCIALRNDEKTTGKCVRSGVRACERTCVCFVFVLYVLRMYI